MLIIQWDNVSDGSMVSWMLFGMSRVMKGATQIRRVWMRGKQIYLYTALQNTYHLVI